MGSKIAAARLAARAGCRAVIASGRDPAIVPRLFASSDEGTHVTAKRAGSKRKRWLAFATNPTGELCVNDGARDAMSNRGASLLPVGVVSVGGDFAAGAVVAICTADGTPFARGITGRSAAECRKLIGANAQRPLVHRNDVVLLGAST